MDERTIARFWSKVDRSAGPTGCWIWTASKNTGGYGHVFVGGRLQGAHRVAYELTNGPVPKGDGYHGTVVCHHCDVRACVNPAHLFIGAQSDNHADMMRKGRHPARPCRGEANGASKLTETLVRQIRDLRASGVTGAEVARLLGVSQGTVSRAYRGIGWAHVT